MRCPQPGCGLAVTILERWTMRSAQGRSGRGYVEHIKVRCNKGHWFAGSVTSLAGEPWESDDSLDAPLP